ncbi:MAG: acyl carrier protein [Clostridiales bacterium]|jgi:acyl carrier protein|nr:acyl carrier protein [Clostridiales bacterium]
MLDKLIGVLRDYKGDENFVITPDTTFEELNLDSLDIMDLVMQVEDAFHCGEINIDKNVKKVSDLLRLIIDAQ